VSGLSVVLEHRAKATLRRRTFDHSRLSYDELLCDYLQLHRTGAL